jgi:3-deoxy-manno-octulosonate cytidylyltransferase (CMP-KDO synthetase)
VVTDRGQRALYFSRTPVPYDRDGSGSVHYFKHLGLYAYRAAALERFRTLAPSCLEEIEKLEQLRFLENGIPIAVVETAVDTIGVDTERDLRRVEALFLAGGVTLPGEAPANRG